MVVRKMSLKLAMSLTCFFPRVHIPLLGYRLFRGDEFNISGRLASRPSEQGKLLLTLCINPCRVRVIARPRMGGGGRGMALYTAIPPPPHFDNGGHIVTIPVVSHRIRARLRISACHVHAATILLEDACCACTFRYACASESCGAGTLKHGAFGFERGRLKREGGAAPWYDALVRILRGKEEQDMDPITTLPSILCAILWHCGAIHTQGIVRCMLAWLRNVNIAILVSHVSWNVLTSSSLLAQPCICTIALNGHAPISNLHCQFLCCCRLLQVKISLNPPPPHPTTSLNFSHSLLLKVNKVKGLAGPFTT